MLHFIWINEYIFIFILLQFILHLNSNTKFNLKWNRNNPKETGKKGGPLVPVGNTNRDQRGCLPRWRWQTLWSQRASFVPVAWPRTKKGTLLSRLGGLGWETRTKGLSQPGQKVYSVVMVGTLSFNLPKKKSYALEALTLVECTCDHVCRHTASATNHANV